MEVEAGRGVCRPSTNGPGSGASGSEGQFWCVMRRNLDGLLQTQNRPVWGREEGPLSGGWSIYGGYPSGNGPTCMLRNANLAFR